MPSFADLLELPWTVAGACRDRTIRLWGPPAETLASAPLQHRGAAGVTRVLAPDAGVCKPWTFGGRHAGMRDGGQSVVVALESQPPGAAPHERWPARGGAGAPGGDELVFAIVDGAAGVLLWRLVSSDGYKPLDADLGIDSRRAARLPMPDAHRVVCLATHPAKPSVLVCGCERGVVVILTLGPSSTWQPNAHGNAHASAAAVRVVRAAPGGEAVSHVVWSADGVWLHASVGESIISMRDADEIDGSSPLEVG